MIKLEFAPMTHAYPVDAQEARVGADPGVLPKRTGSLGRQPDKQAMTQKIFVTQILEPRHAAE